MYSNQVSILITSEIELRLALFTEASIHQRERKDYAKTKRLHSQTPTTTSMMSEN